MNKIRVFIFLFIISVSNLCESQIRFSQFYSAPLLFNPANTGRFDKNYRVGGTFRREKNGQAQLYTQATLFFDSKILNKTIPGNDCFAIGILGLVEHSETEGIKNTYVSFSLGYQKGLNEEGTQQLGIGFQATYARKQLIKPSYIFEDQLLRWATSGYKDIDIFRLGNVDITYIDVNAGLVYQGVINTKSFFTAGVSMYHINKPTRVFQGGVLSILPKTWGHLAWENNFADSKKIYAAVILGYSDKTIDDLLAGLNYQIGINRANYFNFGCWFKKSAIRGNAIVPAVGLLFNGITLLTSYDINISSKNTSQRGASEISMIYKIALKRENFLEHKFITF